MQRRGRREKESSTVCCKRRCYEIMVGCRDCNEVGARGFFLFQGEGGIRYDLVTGVQTCALPISFDAAVDRAPVADAEVRGRPFEIDRGVERADLRAIVGVAVDRVEAGRRLPLERELVPVEHRTRADAEVVREGEPVAEQRNRLQLQLRVVVDIVVGVRLFEVVGVRVGAPRGALAQGERQLESSAEGAAANAERVVRRGKAGKSQERQYRGGEK